MLLPAISMRWPNSGEPSTARYDDFESGRVKSIKGDEMKARLRARSAARQAG
jgi:hypothetical protein